MIQGRSYHPILLRNICFLTIRKKTTGLRNDLNQCSHFMLKKTNTKKQEEQKKEKTFVLCR